MKKYDLVVVPKDDIPELKTKRVEREDGERRLFIAWTGRTPEDWMEHFEAGRIQLFEPNGMTILKMCCRLLGV